jgi:hypothetical protein
MLLHFSEVSSNAEESDVSEKNKEAQESVSDQAVNDSDRASTFRAILAKRGLLRFADTVERVVRQYRE